MLDSDDIIVLDSVPIITPNKDIVVDSLSFQVRNIWVGTRMIDLVTTLSQRCDKVVKINSNNGATLYAKNVPSIVYPQLVAHQ